MELITTLANCTQITISLNSKSILGLKRAETMKTNAISKNALIIDSTFNG